MTSYPDSNNGTLLTLEEVNRSLPRKVRPFSDDMRRLIWFVAVFLGGSALWFSGYSYYAIRQSQEQSALHNHGKSASARITERTWSRSGLSVEYKFEVDGTTYAGHALLPSEQRIDSAKGQSLEIAYLPESPSVSHPTEWSSSIWSDLIPNLFMLFFSALGIAGARLIYRERKLARFGWVVEGRVVACRQNKRKFRVDYEFNTEDNRVIQGANYYADEYQSGSPIRIIYLRSAPERNDCYPMASYHTLG